MAAFAKVKLTEDANFQGVPYKKDDVLRVESATAKRLVTLKQAAAYDGTAKGKNEPKEEPEKVEAK